MGRGALTPSPTWNIPGPTPGPPCPDPTPPPLPLPIPPPTPTPFEGVISFESGSPSCVFGGVLISAITVGSIINLLFCWTNTVGGVNCCFAAFGGVPADALSLLASPPPPPLGPSFPTFNGT